MKTLFILNEGPYGSERCYNGLRLAGALVKREGQEVRMFLMGDAVGIAKRGQKVPQGYYSVEVMLRHVCRSGSVSVCGTCIDARGICKEELAEGVERGSMEELTDWTLWADRHIVF